MAEGFSMGFGHMSNSQLQPAPSEIRISFGAVQGPAAINAPPPAQIDSQMWRFSGRSTAIMFVPTPMHSPDDERAGTECPQMMNLSAMPPFEGYSPEELRIQHYKYLQHKGNKKKAKAPCNKSLQPTEPSDTKGTDPRKVASCFGVQLDEAGFGANTAADEGTSRSMEPSQMPAAFPTPTAPPMPVATEAAPTSSHSDGIGIPIERNTPSTNPSGTGEALPGTDVSGGDKVDDGKPGTSSAHVVGISTDEVDGKVCPSKDDTQQSGGDGLCVDGPQISSGVNTSTSEAPRGCTFGTANKGNCTAGDNVSGAGTSSSLFGGDAFSGLFEKMKVGGSHFTDQNGGTTGHSLFGGPSKSLFENMNGGGLFGTTQSGPSQPSGFGGGRSDHGFRTDTKPPLSTFPPTNTRTGPQNGSIFGHGFGGFTMNNNTPSPFSGGFAGPSTAVITPPTDPPPGVFICPISMSLIKEPVLLMTNGITYDKSSLLDWYKSRNMEPPLAKENKAVKKMIDAWIAKQKQGINSCMPF